MVKESKYIKHMIRLTNKNIKYEMKKLNTHTDTLNSQLGKNGNMDCQQPKWIWCCFFFVQSFYRNVVAYEKIPKHSISKILLTFIFPDWRWRQPQQHQHLKIPFLRYAVAKRNSSFLFSIVLFLVLKLIYIFL